MPLDLSSWERRSLGAVSALVLGLTLTPVATTFGAPEQPKTAVCDAEGLKIQVGRVEPMDEVLRTRVGVTGIESVNGRLEATLSLSGAPTGRPEDIAPNGTYNPTRHVVAGDTFDFVGTKVTVNGVCQDDVALSFVFPKGHKPRREVVADKKAFDAGFRVQPNDVTPNIVPEPTDTTRPPIPSGTDSPTTTSTTRPPTSTTTKPPSSTTKPPAPTETGPTTPPPPKPSDDAQHVIDLVATLFDESSNDRAQLNEIAEAFRDLSDKDLTVAVGAIPEEQFNFLGSAAKDLSIRTSAKNVDGLRAGGMTMWGRVDMSSDLLARLDATLLRKVVKAMPWVNPAFDKTSPVVEKGREYNYDFPLWTQNLTLDNKGEISYTEPMQGSIGDCWLAGGISSAALMDADKFASRIKENPNRTASVGMFELGTSKMHWVTVTRDLPYWWDPEQERFRVLGEKAANGVLWPSYVEKAFAIIYTGDRGGMPQGSYAALESDYIGAAGPNLVGKQGQYLRGFADLKRAFEGGNIALVGTKQDKNGIPASIKDDYIPKHTLYVLKTTGTTITLGNPWGVDQKVLTVNESVFNASFVSPYTVVP